MGLGRAGRWRGAGHCRQQLLGLGQPVAPGRRAVEGGQRHGCGAVTGASRAAGPGADTLTSAIARTGAVARRVHQR